MNILEELYSPLPALSERVLSQTCAPLRATTIGSEYYFLLTWVETNDKSDVLTQILGEKPNDRDRKVAGSVIQWLGTQIGLLFLVEARRHVDDLFSLKDALSKLWIRENIRRWYVNFGWTQLEGILFSRGLERSRPNLTVRDEEVAAKVVAWLGTRSGIVFVKVVEKRIEKLQKDRTVEFNRRWNKGVLAPVGGS